MERAARKAVQVLERLDRHQDGLVDFMSSALETSDDRIDFLGRGDGHLQDPARQ